jgi:hypothetical protein
VVTPDRFDAETVRQAVSEVLGGGSHLLAALRMGDEIAAMPSVESVALDLPAATRRCGEVGLAPIRRTHAGRKPVALPSRPG